MRYVDPAAERPLDVPCPPGHTDYGSEQLAENAAYLHTLAHPSCTTIVAFVHGDHWHVGHSDRDAGKVCRAEADRKGHRARVAAEKAARGRRRG